MRYVFLFILFLSIHACTTSTDAPKNQLPYEVNCIGALKDIMHQADISAKASLDSFSTVEHLYALGPLENLQGEFIILDGTPYISTVQHAELVVRESFHHNASLLVYSKVAEWATYDIPKDVESSEQLEVYIEKTAAENGIDTEQAFPFLLTGMAKYIDWHVVNWNVEDTEHTHEKHIMSGPHGQISHREVEILGFYSKHHHAIFTHHTTNMHLHFRTTDGVLAGHLDKLTPGSRLKLQLPKTSNQ